MNREEVLQFVMKNPVSHMATLKDGEPRVRAMQTAHVDSHGMTFCTGIHKDIYKQLMANQSVELAYWDSEGGVQVRVRGEMEYLDDLAIKKSLEIDYPRSKTTGYSANFILT